MNIIWAFHHTENGQHNIFKSEYYSSAELDKKFTLNIVKYLLCSSLIHESSCAVTGDLHFAVIRVYHNLNIGLDYYIKPDRGL